MPNRKAEDILTHEVVTFTPETGPCEAMSVLPSRKSSGASVVDSEGTLVGVLSERDCLRVIAALVLKRPIRGLPVVEEDARLVGQIHRRDVLWAIESMREHDLYPKQEHELDTRNDGLGGVSSAVEKARGL